MKDVIVIGAGIIGSSIARKLSQYKLDILVLEAQNDVSMGATKANSAIVHGGYAEKHEKLKGRLCYKGRIQFHRLNKELNFGYTQNGSLVIAFEEENLPKLEELLENGKKNGLEDLKIIGHDEIMRLESNINPEVKYALYCKGAGITSPYEMCIALMENAIHNGVELKLNSKVASIDKKDEYFVVEDINGDKHEGKIVINCGGISSAEISKMVGLEDFTITPRSGEYIIFERGTGSTMNQVVFQMPTKMGKGILVTPTYHGNLLLGPDAMEDGFDLETHGQRLIKIYESAKRTTTHMNPKKFLSSFVGIRAVSSTNDFIIEASKVKGFIQCAGIQSPGLTSSPAIADMVVEIIENELMKLEKKEDFDPYRKPIIEKKELLPMNKIMPLVKMESGNERIVCRCEQVSEETIIDALSREIPVTTIDGVKRRTRAGMGFCQGNFCRPRVKELMERILGEAIDDRFDIEHSGINRVEKSEFLDYLKNEENNIDM